MHPKEVAALMSRATKLVREGKLTHHTFVVLHNLVFCCRRPGTVEFSIPYKRIAKLAGCAYQTAVDAVKALCDLGFVVKRPNRVRAHGRSFVAANTYRLINAPACESTAKAAIQMLIKTKANRKEAPRFEGSALDLALQQLERAIAARGECPG